MIIFIKTGGNHSHYKMWCEENYRSFSTWTLSKSFCSMVLLAVYNRNYCFTYFDLDEYGNRNDCLVSCVLLYILCQWIMGGLFAINAFNVQTLSTYRSFTFDPLSYFIWRKFFIFFHWMRNILSFFCRKFQCF